MSARPCRTLYAFPQIKERKKEELFMLNSKHQDGAHVSTVINLVILEIFAPTEMILF